jgi:hypothetical protein
VRERAYQPFARVGRQVEEARDLRERERESGRMAYLGSESLQEHVARDDVAAFGVCGAIGQHAGSEAIGWPRGDARKGENHAENCAVCGGSAIDVLFVFQPCTTRVLNCDLRTESGEVRAHPPMST